MVGLRGAALVLALVFAGCTSNGPSNERGEKPVQPAALPEPTDVKFSIVANGDEYEIAALVWLPSNATTAITLVHGFSGTARNFFHTLPEKGSSFGARLALTGRAVFALDMPGYGRSSGVRTDLDLESGEGLLRMAAVLDAVADAIRVGEYAPFGLAFTHVVGSGNSMGSMISDTAQGQFASFDAIMPGGVSHRGLKSCATGDPINCPAEPNDDFWMPNADPDVANATTDGYEKPHLVNLATINAWTGSCYQLVGQPNVIPCGRPSPWDRFVEPVTVPVLAFNGNRDNYFDTSNPVGEGAFYPNSRNVTVLHYTDVGHVVHNHLNQPEVVANIDAVLDAWAL